MITKRYTQTRNLYYYDVSVLRRWNSSITDGKFRPSFASFSLQPADRFLITSVPNAQACKGSDGQPGKFNLELQSAIFECFEPLGRDDEQVVFIIKLGNTLQF